MIFIMFFIILFLRKGWQRHPLLLEKKMKFKHAIYCSKDKVDYRTRVKYHFEINTIIVTKGCGEKVSINKKKTFLFCNFFCQSLFQLYHFIPNYRYKSNY